MPSYHRREKYPEIKLLSNIIKYYKLKHSCNIFEFRLRVIFLLSFLDVGDIRPVLIAPANILKILE